MPTRPDTEHLHPYGHQDVLVHHGAGLEEADRRRDIDQNDVVAGLIGSKAWMKECSRAICVEIRSSARLVSGLRLVSRCCRGLGQALGECQPVDQKSTRNCFGLTPIRL
jgi:hypothetical protein